MAIRNKCYNTCFYLQDRFSIRKLFLVRHGTLRILSWWAEPIHIIWIYMKLTRMYFCTHVWAGGRHLKIWFTSRFGFIINDLLFLLSYQFVVLHFCINCSSFTKIHKYHRLFIETMFYIVIFSFSSCKLLHQTHLKAKVSENLFQGK
jgi:hypothetical protein